MRTRNSDGVAEEACNTLQSIGEDTSFEEILTSLSTLSEYLRHNSLNSGQYSALCKAVIDRVLPCLHSCHVDAEREAASHIEHIFLLGDPTIAFLELCTALRLGSRRSEVVALTLLGFVSRRTGGLKRLSHVLSTADAPETVTFLVHLPSRINNTLQLSGTEALLLDEDEYFSVLVDALCSLSSTSDQHASSFVADLLHRMVVLKKTDLIVSQCLSHHSLNIVESVVLRAPPNSIEGLTRAMLETSTKSPNEERRLIRALHSILKESLSARDACVSRIPSGPPLRRPRISLKRLSYAVVHASGSDAARSAIVQAAELWSSPQFALGADILQQRQVTRLLLYYMGQIQASTLAFEDPSQSFMVLLAPGIQLRLDESDPRIRRHAMVIGEASSKLDGNGPPMKFERDDVLQAMREDKTVVGDEYTEDGSDSDFSEIAQDLRGYVSDCEDTGDCDDLEHRGSTAEPVRASDVESKDDSVEVGLAHPRYHLQEAGVAWPSQEAEDEWLTCDDWESVRSWEELCSPDSDLPGTLVSIQIGEALYSAVSSTMSVPRLLGLLREANGSSGGALAVDPETLNAALETIARHCQETISNVDTFRLAAVEFCMEVFRIQVERYPDKEVERMNKLRQQGLEALIRLDFGQCGVALVSRIICGASSDISSRIEGLVLLSQAVRGLRGLPNEQREVSFDEKALQSQAIVPVGVAWKRKGKDRTPRSEASALKPRRTDVGDICRVFLVLADGLCQGGGAEFLQLEGRDSQLWAQGLVTLATLACSGGTGRPGTTMRAAVLEISIRRVAKIDGDAVVRRAVALALGAVVEAMTSQEASEYLLGTAAGYGLKLSAEGLEGEIINECSNWLIQATEHDADVGVRRFARLALGRWARLADDISAN